MTSHIIQDLERLVDDCIILDYGRILTQMPVDRLLDQFGRYVFTTTDDNVLMPADDRIINPGKIRNEVELYTFDGMDYVKEYLTANNISYKDLKRTPMSLEDAFIGLTGKY